jgi:hypothetical protein
MNELDLVAKNLPLEKNFSKYLLIKTKINNYTDMKIRISLTIDKMIQKFDLSPLINSLNKLKNNIIDVDKKLLVIKYKGSNKKKSKKNSVNFGPDRLPRLI